MDGLLEKIFAHRGYEPGYLDRINAQMGGYPYGTEEACELLHQFAVSGEQIVLYTDFDMDGIASGIIGYAGLSELGFNVAMSIPTSTKYGMDISDVEHIRAEYPDAGLLITADVGIQATPAILAAKHPGQGKPMKVIVTDHHMPDKNFKRVADVTIDPSLTRTEGHSERCYDRICGAYVLWTMLDYYARHYVDNAPYFIRQIERLRIFVGLGTVGDSMPMLYDNRAMVADAISGCKFFYAEGSTDPVNMMEWRHAVYQRAFYGLYWLLKTFADNGKLTSPQLMDEDFIGFYLAPSVNAVKRMDEDITKVYNVFFGADPKQAAQEVYDCNERRKKRVDHLMERLLDSIQPYAPFIYVVPPADEEEDVCGRGLCGLLAQKIVSLTGLPAFVVADGLDPSGHYVYAGSGRMPYGMSIFDFIDEYHLQFYAAGHDSAFGVTFLDENELEELHEALKDWHDNGAYARMVESVPDPVDLTIDLHTTDADRYADYDLPALYELMRGIDNCRPFGPGFPKPVLRLRFRVEDAKWTLVGHDDPQKHLRITLPYGFRVMCWNQADQVRFHETVDPDGHVIDTRIMKPDGTPVGDVEATGSLEYNYYKDICTLQFKCDQLTLL